MSAKRLVLTGLQDCGSMLPKYFSFVSLCKYLSTAGLGEQNINVTQSWSGILKFILSLKILDPASRVLMGLMRISECEGKF